MRRIDFSVDSSYDGRRVLALLRAHGLSSRIIRSLKQIPDGILLNGSHIRTVDIIHAGDTLTVNLPDDNSAAQPSDIPLDIIYTDDDILVVNKPAGLAMHPTHNHQGDTLANAEAEYFARQGKTVVFRAVGRLDKCTSGVVILALNAFAASKLSGALTKTYFAVCEGELSGAGIINKPIVRPDPMKTLRATGEDGLPAVTSWTALRAGNGRTLVKVEPLSGRTHQIRVHFASIGHPLAGDDMYGSTDTAIGRAALHCGCVRLDHPVTGESMEFNAPLPDDMAKLI